MDLVGVAGKVSQGLYGSLEIHKQGGQEGLPAVQRLHRLKYGADEENSRKRYYIKDPSDKSLHIVSVRVT